MPKTIKLCLTALLGMLLAIVVHFLMHHQARLHAKSLTQEQALSLLKLPPGFVIERVADLHAWGHPRMMTLDNHGKLLVTLNDSGRVARLDASGQVEIVIEGLHAPNGIARLGDDLLIAEPDRVLRVAAKGSGWGTATPFITQLPAGGHSLKTVKVSPTGEIFVNVGSSCNVCIEEDPLRASLLRFHPDGRPAGALETLGRHAQSPIWARGLRNTQGWAWHPVTGDMFASNAGADNRRASAQGPVDDDLPPEHLNLIEGGQVYGWPYCWANPQPPHTLVQDPTVLTSENICLNARPPALTLPAHSTPIGLTFLDQSRFGDDWKQDAIIALHGSWNRKQPSGYSLMRIQFRNQQPISAVPFVTGWLQGQAAWGRPVDVVIGSDGWLYVSDDRTDWIYRIRQAHPS